MFDQRKAQELQNKSHVRGKLNKQFFSSQQEQLQRKRKQMKFILDQQIQENKKQKEKAKYQQEKKIQDEQDKIKAYYAQVEERQRRISGHSIGNSNVFQNGQSNFQGISLGNKINRSGLYESRASAQQNVIQRNRSKSRAQLEIQAGDIPVMPLVNSHQKNNNFGFQNYNGELHNSNFADRQHRNSHKSSAGNIPLLELSQDEQKRQRKKTKRTPTKRDEKQKIIMKIERVQRIISKQKKQNPTQEQINEYIINSRQNTQQKQVLGELNEQLEEQNKQLKKQLKINQQAISLLIGAVKSNVKFDKYRVQAEKILHGQNSLETKITPITQIDSRVKKPSTRSGHEKEQIKEKLSILPKLKLRHQSMMHDYMFGSAKKAHIKTKTFK